jgi:hypothetical protein
VWGKNMKKFLKKMLVGISIKFPILQIIVFSGMSVLIIHLALATTLQEYKEYTVVLERQADSQIVFVAFAEDLDENISELYNDGNKALLFHSGKDYEVTLYCDSTDSEQSKYYFINSPDVSLDAERIKVVSGNHNLFDSIINKLTRRNYEK